MAKKTATPLAPGACRLTKKRVQYCHIPNVGVRFTKKPLSGLGQPTGQRCLRYRPVTIKSGPQKGKKVKRCAEFAGLAQPTGQRCVRYRPVTIKSGPQRGQRVKRCAEYA